MKTSEKHDSDQMAKGCMRKCSFLHLSTLIFQWFISAKFLRQKLSKLAWFSNTNHCPDSWPKLLKTSEIHDSDQMTKGCMRKCSFAYLYTLAPATWRGRPKWSPAWLAPLFEPIWSPMTFCPSFSCSSVNSRLLAVASLGPSWGTALPILWHCWSFVCVVV